MRAAGARELSLGVATLTWETRLLTVGPTSSIAGPTLMSAAKMPSWGVIALTWETPVLTVGPTLKS